MLDILLEFNGNELDNYFSLAKRFPHFFKKNKSFEILLDPIEIQHAEEREYERWLSQNIPPHLAKEWSRVGLISFDSYVLWIRDAVRYPNGSTTLFKRIMYTFMLQQPKAVAICGLTSDQHVVLIKIWRHALQKYVLEIPRGTPEFKEDLVDCAVREFEEETGYSVYQIESLGTVTPDSGILSHEVEVFFAKVGSQKSTLFDPDEGIVQVCTIPFNQILQKINPIDPYLNYAILRRL